MSFSMVTGRKLRQRELRAVGHIVVLVAVMAMVAVAVQWRFGMNAIDLCTKYNVKSNKKKKKRCRVDWRLLTMRFLRRKLAFMSWLVMAPEAVCTVRAFHVSILRLLLRSRWNYNMCLGVVLQRDGDISALNKVGGLLMGYFVVVKVIAVIQRERVL